MIKKGKYGLPLEVRFCRRCTMSNQRPMSTVEFESNSATEKKSLVFDEDGVCQACRYAEQKKLIDWDKRAGELSVLCDRFRRDDGRYDVIVPGSGGKDSIKAAIVLRDEYRMNPLLVTWPPAMITQIGKRNFDAWLDAGFANITYYQNRKVHRRLTRDAFVNLCHPFQPFILGQKNYAARMSMIMKVPLVVYGENEAEYGNPIEDNQSPERDKKWFSSMSDLKELRIGGRKVGNIMEEYLCSLADLAPYLPCNSEELEENGTEVHYLGYYKKWHPQESYYFAAVNSGFRPNTTRTEGSYSKYSSIDDKIDWLHYYTTYAKFGIGRATYDSAQEIRNGDITREEGIMLVDRFDGEYPRQYLNDCLEYMGLSKSEFDEIVNAARPEHLWYKDKAGKYQLRNKIR